MPNNNILRICSCNEQHDIAGGASYIERIADNYRHIVLEQNL